MNNPDRRYSEIKLIRLRNPDLGMVVARPAEGRGRCFLTLRDDAEFLDPAIIPGEGNFDHEREWFNEYRRKTEGRKIVFSFTDLSQIIKLMELRGASPDEIKAYEARRISRALQPSKIRFAN